jgi:hypothetical protein
MKHVERILTLNFPLAISLIMILKQWGLGLRIIQTKRYNVNIKTAEVNK